MEVKRLIIVFIVSILFITKSLAQPNWVPLTGPTIGTTGPLTIPVNFGIDMPGTVYIAVYNVYATTTPTSAYIRTIALEGPSGIRVATAIITVTAGNTGTLMQEIMNVVNANRQHTIWIVAADASGTLQADPVRLYATTTSCPPIKLFTYFGSVGECVNTGASGMYQVGLLAGPTGPLPTGVLKGTTFTVNWGDGSSWTYTAAADGDLPPAQYHTFTSVDSCAYQGSWVVKSPCNEFLSNTGVFVVHGRDIEEEGDGDLIMEEIVTHVRNRIRVCEGTEHRITLSDVSQWNCQSPEVPFPLNPADYDNDKPRTIQFVYGETPTGTVGDNNTISGDVLIGPSNIADGTNGIIGSVIGPLNPANPNTQSDVITIPATCRAGEQFVVYLKNWNKCNPYVSPDLDYVYDDFVIEIIPAPPAPQPTETPDYCEGSVPTRITVTRSNPQGIIRWYSDEALTHLIRTGTYYTHGRTAPGTYYYWVTETSGQNGCVSPATQITLVIRPEIENNSIGTAQSICYNTDPANLTGLLPTGGNDSYAYQWERSTTSATSGFSSAPGTSTLRNYDIPGPLTQTTWYRRVVISGPCRDVSNVIRIEVYGDLNPGTVSAAQTICYNTAPATLTTGTSPSGGPGSYTYQWEVSTNNVNWSTISGATESSFSPPALTSNRYYRRIVTSGSCGSEPTPSILITVMPDLTPGSIGSDQTICYNTVPAQLTSATAPSGGSGSYSYLWQESDDNSSWTDISSATGANYTPPALTTETYFRRRVISAGCTPVYSNSVLITLNPLPQPAISGDVSPCFNVQRVYTTSSVTNHSYSWTVSNGVIVGSSTGNSVTVRWNVAPGPAWVRVTERNNTTGCQATTSLYIVTVNPEAPEAAGPISGQTNVCFGEQNVPFSIATVANATTYVWTLPAGVTLVSGGGTRSIVVNFGTSVVSPAVLSVYASNGCGQGTSSSISVNIYGQLNGGSIGSSQTICYGENVPAFTSITAASGGSGSFSYRWQMTTDPAAVPGGTGWSDVPGGTSLALDYGTLTTTTRFVRRAINATCTTPVYSNVITVTVRPQLDGGDINSSQTICYGADPDAFTSGGPATGGSNNFTYTWQYTTNMTAPVGDAAWQDINTAHGLGYDHGILTTTTRFVRKAVDASCSTPVYSDILTVTVRSELSGGTVRTDQTICYGDDVARFDNVTAASGGGGSFTYSWYYTTNLLATPGGAGWVQVPSATGTSYNHGTLTASTKFIRRAVDATCSTPVYSNEVIVTVRPETDGGEIGENRTICYGEDVPSFTSTEDASGGSNSFTYTWFLTTNMTAVPGGPGWTQINSSNNHVYDHGTLTQTTRFIRRAVDAACTDPEYSNVITITVRPQLSGGAVTDDQTICYGDDVAAFQSSSPASGGEGNFTYTWQYTTDMAAAPGAPGWTDILPSNSLTYNHGTLTETTRFVRKAVEATCNTPVYSNVIRVTVRPVLSGGIIAADQVICYNADAEALTSSSNASGGSGSFTYTWQITTNMSAAVGDGTWTSINGSNSATYDPGTLTISTRFVRMAVDAVCSGPVYSNEVKVTVRPQATGGVIASPQTICPGDDVAAFTSTSDASGASGSFTYTWYYTTDMLALPGSAAWIPVTASDSPVYDHGTMTQTTRFVRMAVDAVCAGPVYSNVIQVSVLPAPSGGVIGTSIPVCYGSDVPAFTDEVPASGGSGSFTYMWQYTTNMTAIPGDGNWIDINNSNSASYDHGTLELPTKFVRRATDAFCTNPVWSNEITVSINPLPVTSDIKGKSIMCEDDNDQIYRVDPAAGSSWFWTVPASMTIASPQGFNVIIVKINGPSASGDMISVTETNTVTGCIGDPVFFPVTILPVIPATIVSGPEDVCVGDVGISFSVPDNPGSTYTWFVPAGASITSDPKQHQIEVTFNMALTGQVTCIATSNSVCTTIHDPASVTVHPLPLAYNLTAQSYYCSGSSGVTVTLSNSQTGVNYQLYRNGVAEGPVVTGTGSSLSWPGMEEGVYHVNAVMADHPFCGVMMNGNPVVEEVPPIIINSVTATDPLCHDGSDGSIVINASGGYPPVSTLTYSIDGGLNFIASNTFSNVGMGSYNIVVQDLRGCTAIYGPVEVNQPDPLAVSVSVTGTIDCYGSDNGSARVVATGGTPGYTYQWYYDSFMINPIEGSTSDEVQNLAAGTWYVRVTDSKGCQVTGQVTISQPPQISGSAAVTSMITCYEDNDGEITITANGGSGNLGYELNGDNNWTSSGIFSNLAAGSYTIRVRDELNPSCIISLQALTVTQPPELIVSLVSKGDVFCYGGSGGSISINTSGGTIPAGGYIYEWSGLDYLGNIFSSTQKNLTTLRAGTYSVRVTDANGCQALLTDIIVSQPSELFIAVDDVTNVECFNGSTGEIQVTVSGGVMPSEGYYFTWTGTTFQGMTFNSFVEDLSGVKAGTYRLTVRDANGCSAVLPPVTITQPVELVVVTESITNVECFDNATGAVDITVTGGTEPAGGYLYSWAGTDYTGNAFTGNSQDLVNVKAGTYMLTVTDANNCSVTLPAVMITQPADLNVSVVSESDVRCYGESTGSISVAVTGGTMPSGGYYYSWTGTDYLGNAFSANTNGLTGIPAGTYSLTVTDANGCTASILPVTISMPPALALNVNVISDYNGRDISCAGASDGRAEAVVTGGTGIYFYTWYSDPLFNVPIGQMSPVAINLAAGDYYVRVMDMNGCSITDDVILNAPLPLDADITSQTNVDCFGNANGAVTVTVTATTGTGPYSFSKDGGNTWQDNGTFTGLPAMPYAVLVRDINNCLISVPVLITQPVQLMATVTAVTNVSCNGGNNGSVTATVSAGSGTAPYEFSINGTDWQPSGTFAGLAAGSYTLMVRDDNSCTVTLPVVITEPPVLTLTATPDVVLDCFDDIDGMGTFYATGGTPGYTFTQLENSAQATIPLQGYNTQVFFNAGSGTVAFRVTDSKGCVAEASVNLTQPSALLPGTVGDDQVLCYGEMPGMIGELSTPSGGPQPADYRYQWQYSVTGSEPFISIAGATGPEFTPSEVATGTLYYRRMVTSGFCQPVYSNIVKVAVNPRPIAVLRGGAVICPGESAVLNVDILAGTGPFEIEIEPGILVQNYISGNPIVVTPDLTTTYRLVRITDVNNCEVNAPSPNISGEAIVEVSALPSITSFTPSPGVCEFSFATFSVTATGSNLTYQWWVDDGSGYAIVEDGGTYFGANSNNLLIFTALREMDGNVYKVVVSGCGIEMESDDAVFRVNTAPELTMHPRDTVICLGQDAIMEADATGDGITWQWFVNRGAGFVPVTDDGILFSGSETNSLTITNPPFSASPWVFRAIADGDCGVPVYTGFAVMRVINPPLVTRQPEVNPVCEGGNIQLNASGTNYTSLQWQINTGGGWTDITDGAPYLGARSQQLNIMSVPQSFDGYRYRLAFMTSCAVEYTDEVTLEINSNPVIGFAVDPVLACGGEDIILDGNPSGGSGVFTNHRWTGDVGPLSSYVTENPVFKTLVPGDYLLNYRVEDSNGCTATGDVTITVDSPSAMFTHDADFGCTPLPVTFSADLDDVVKWWWDFDDGSPLDSVSTNPVHVFINDDPASIDYHEVSLKVMSAGGCYSTFSSTIMVYPGIDADFTPDRDVICSGETVFFTSTQGASRYYWDFGDNSQVYATNNTSHLFVNHGDAPITYTVRLTTTSFYNCIDEETHEITVMPVPVPQFNALPPTQIFNTSGNSVTFVNETNEGSWNWLWRFGDGSTSTTEEPVHIYTTPGEFNVTLIVTNNTCSDSVSHRISVLPPPPVADFDSIPSGCAPLYIHINNTSLNTDLPGTSYKWDFGDGSYSTAKNPTYTFFTAGSYRIELTVTGPGGTSVESQVVNVYPSPKAYFEVTPTKVIVNDERVRCFNLSEGAGSYVWDFGDGDTSRVKEPYHRYMQEGIYDITLWAYSENGCADQYKLTPAVTVEPPGVLRFATVFTPNKEGPVERTDLPTGGVEIDQFFFPPVRDRVLEYKLQIFNRWGVLIFESHDINVPWNGYYNGALCQQGVYVWYVEGKYSDGRPYKQVGNVTLLH